MRILAVILLSLVSVTCYAMLPEYFSSRQWIEQHTPKNQTPQEDRIFVGDSIATTNTYILRYHDGISLRDVVDSTHYKDSDVFVIVLRSEQKTQPVLSSALKRGAKPAFKLRAQDVIWISQAHIDIN
ncbi:MAG: hypothetical protein WCS94_14645 [Verrucomicrobiota bacterium]